MKHVKKQMIKKLYISLQQPFELISYNSQTDKNTNVLSIVYHFYPISGNRLRNFDVKVGDVGPLHYTGRHFRLIAHIRRSVGRGGTITIKPGSMPIAGRYLVVQLNHRGYLTLCEVQVYGSKLILFNTRSMVLVMSLRYSI